MKSQIQSLNLQITDLKARKYELLHDIATKKSDSKFDDKNLQSDQAQLLDEKQKAKIPDEIPKTKFLEKRSNRSIVEHTFQDIYDSWNEEIEHLAAKSNNLAEAEHFQPKSEYSKAQVDAICVRFISVMPQGFQKSMGLASITNYFQATFRITKKTNNQEIKEACQQFWKVKSGSFILMDDKFEKMEGTYKLIDDKVSQIENAAIFYFVPKEMETLEKTTNSNLGKQINNNAVSEETKGALIEKKIYGVFPKIKSFLDLSQVKKNQVSSRAYKYVALEIILIIIIAVINAEEQKKSQNTIEYSIISQAKERFDPALYRDSVGQDVMEYDDITDFDDLYLYLRNTVAVALVGAQDFTNLTIYSPRFVVIGKILLQQVRTKKKPCKYLNLTNCTYTDVTPSTEDKEILFGTGDDSPSWALYQTNEQTSLNSSVKGILQTYPSSGYFFEISAEASLEEFQQNVTELEEKNFLSFQTKALIVHANMYHVTSSVIIIMKFIFEFTPFGTIITKGPIFQLISINITKLPNFVLFLILRIIILLLLIVTLIGLVLVYKGKTYIATFSGISTAVVIFTCVAQLILIILMIFLEDHSVTVFSETEFTDFVTDTSWYLGMRVLRGLLFLVIIIKSVDILTKYTALGYFMQTLIDAISELTRYLGLYMIYLIGFSIAGYCIWGAVDLSYNNFTEAFYNMLLITIRKGKPYYENPTLVEDFSLFIINFFLNFLYITIFAAICAESTRQLALYKNYKPALLENYDWKNILVDLKKKIQDTKSYIAKSFSNFVKKLRKRRSQKKKAHADFQV